MAQGQRCGAPSKNIYTHTNSTSCNKKKYRNEDMYTVEQFI